MTPISWKDEYSLTEHRKILMHQQTRIPGLALLGMHVITQEVPVIYDHYHENLFEITYVTNGMIKYAAHGKEYKTSGGYCFVTQPDEVHSIVTSPRTKGKLYWIQLDASTLTNLLYLNGEASCHLLTALRQIPHHVIHTDTEEMHSLIRQAFQICLDGGSQRLAAAYLTLFLKKLISYSAKTQFKLTADIGKSICYILEHISENLSLEELAEGCHLSTSQYKQKFKAQMGISPRTYINMQKIEASKALLQEGKDSVEIAEMLSFNTASYFSTVFKRYTSLSPREYLKNRKEGT